MDLGAGWFGGVWLTCADQYVGLAWCGWLVLIRCW